MSPTGGWRHGSPWFLKRSLALFAIAFALSWIAYWLSARWLQWIAFAIGIASMYMAAIASGEWLRKRWRNFP